MTRTPEEWADFLHTSHEDWSDGLLQEQMIEDMRELLGAIEDLAYQFAYDGRAGTITTGGLSALETAFACLGWDDPHPLPDAMLCEEPGCHERATCGTPTEKGYRTTCSKHAPRRKP